MRALLVGEDNPWGSDPRYALWCEPRHSAGGRLCYDVLGLKSAAEYVRGFERANLCSRKWSMAEARERASKIAREIEKWSAIVLLGQKVCQAFSIAFEPFVAHKGEVGAGSWPRPVVILPHPSGRNRMWNDAGAILRARGALRDAMVLPVASPAIEWPSTRVEWMRAHGDDHPPTTDSTASRPAYCGNCGLLARGDDCAECGAPPERKWCTVCGKRYLGEHRC